MPSLASHVGRNINRLRKMKGLTQEELGEKVQQPQSYISRIERGEKNVSLDTLERIADALGVDPSELFLFSSRLNNKFQAETDSIIDSLVYQLQKRKPNEIQIITKLVSDVLKVFDTRE